MADPKCFDSDPKCFDSEPIFFDSDLDPAPAPAKKNDSDLDPEPNLKKLIKHLINQKTRLGIQERCVRYATFFCVLLKNAAFFLFIIFEFLATYETQKNVAIFAFLLKERAFFKKNACPTLPKNHFVNNQLAIIFDFPFSFRYIFASFCSRTIKNTALES